MNALARLILLKLGTGIAPQFVGCTTLSKFGIRVANKADIAIPITKQLVVDNPGDPQYAKTYWTVLRIAKKYKESVPAGQAYVTIDTSGADTTYFFKQIQDLATDSSFAKAAEMAAVASAKFPTRQKLLP